MRTGTMRRAKAVVLVLSIAGGLTIAALAVRARRDTGAAEGATRRALTAERRIARSCDLAVTSAMLTLRSLRESPEVGLALAMRDANSTVLCGGDAEAISGPAARGDVEGTFRAVLAQTDQWCPDCAALRREKLPVQIDAGI